jgi:hypothetical protein
MTPEEALEVERSIQFQVEERMAAYESAAKARASADLDAKIAILGEQSDARFARLVENSIIKSEERIPVVKPDPERNVRVVQQAVRGGSKPPPVYDGIDKGEKLVTWIRLMDAYLSICSLSDPAWSSSTELIISMSYLDGRAHEAATRVKEIHGIKCDWRMIKLELDSKFGCRKSALVLLNELESIRQGTSSVIDYALEFEHKLDQLLLKNWSDTLTCTKLFMDGLADSVRSKLVELLLCQHDDPMTRFMGMTPAEAIRSVSDLARRREEVSSFLAPHKSVPARVAVVSAAPAVEAVAQPGQSRGVGRPSETVKERTRRLEGVIQSIATQFKLPLALVRDRVRSRLCGACGQSGHMAYGCPRATVSAGVAPQSPPTHDQGNVQAR